MVVEGNTWVNDKKMEITSAEFVISNTDVKKCPAGIFPEYAFIGRSNEMCIRDRYLAVHNRKIVHLNQPDYLSNKAFMNEYGSSSNLVVLLLL